jgi:hypothetical protein
MYVQHTMPYAWRLCEWFNTNSGIEEQSAAFQQLNASVEQLQIALSNHITATSSHPRRKGLPRSMLKLVHDEAENIQKCTTTLTLLLSVVLFPQSLELLRSVDNRLPQLASPYPSIVRLGGNHYTLRALELDKTAVRAWIAGV